MAVADIQVIPHSFGHRRCAGTGRRPDRHRLGRTFALAAARALLSLDLSAEEIARRAMKIAADICIFTNENVIIESLESRMSTFFTPREIVSELDRFIIGQHDAKRAVAIALRNRWRRQQLSPEPARRSSAQEHPDDRADRRRQDGNLAPAGETGAGAVPESRSDQVHRGRLCRPRRRPDRARSSGSRHRAGARPQSAAMSRPRPRRKAEDRVLDALVGASSGNTRESFRKSSARRRTRSTRKSRSRCSDAGGMPSFEIPGMPNAQISAWSISATFSARPSGGRTKTRRVTVADAHAPLVAEEADKLLDNDAIVRDAIDNGGEQRHRLPGRDRQDLRPQRDARRRRCFTRRRAARSLAADRRHDGCDQTWSGEDRSHPLHRLGRVPHGQAFGPAARAAGPSADPRGIEGADARRFPAHPHRTGSQPHQAVCRAAEHRERHARFH